MNTESLFLEHLNKYFLDIILKGFSFGKNQVSVVFLP